MKERPHIGLALSGGATWGIAHIGALKALHEHNIPIHSVAGTSAGAIVASLYAFGISLDHIYQTSRAMRWSTVRKFARSRMGFASNHQIGAMIKHMLGDADIREAGIPLSIVTTNIETGEMTIFRHGDVSKVVCASASIPGYFTPIEIDGNLYVDGGLTENLPISAVKQQGADIVLAVNLSGYYKRFRPRSFKQILGLSIDILTQHRDAAPRKKADILIEPDLSEFNAFSFDQAEALFEAGYRAALEAIPTIIEKMTDFERKQQGVFGRIARRIGWRRSSLSPVPQTVTR